MTGYRDHLAVAAGLALAVVLLTIAVTLFLGGPAADRLHQNPVARGSATPAVR